jgi:hypothetical protein
VNPTRTDIIQQFAQFRSTVLSELTNINSVIQSNVQLNQAVLTDSVDSQTQAVIPLLEREVIAQVEQQLQEEQNSLIAALVMGILAGGGAALAISEMRQQIPRIAARIKTVYEQGLRQLDGAFTLLRSKNSGIEVKYRYSGPTDSDSRQFCQQQSGTILTEAEIRRIWSTQEWGGKRPGDPFVTRGGWNCRHTFIPVGDDE